LVLGVQLEDRALEILHRVGLAVHLRDFLELTRDGLALLCETSMLLPVVEEGAAHRLPCLREGLAIVLLGVSARAG